MDVSLSILHVTNEIVGNTDVEYNTPIILPCYHVLNRFSRGQTVPVEPFFEEGFGKRH